MPPLDRRRFLGSAAATAAFLALHDGALQAAQGAAAPAADPPRPRLVALEMRSGALQATMKAFYGKTLALRVFDEKPDRFSVEAVRGASIKLRTSTRPHVGCRAFLPPYGASSIPPR
jgi:hypothetical protein